MTTESVVNRRQYLDNSQQLLRESLRQLEGALLFVQTQGMADLIQRIADHLNREIPDESGEA